VGATGQLSVTDDNPPSSWRIPLTILFALVAPPLALVAWIALSGSQRRVYLSSGWVRWGFGLAIGSALPLLAVGIAAALGLTSDPNPNPIGLGLLFLAGALIGTILVVIGIIMVASRKN
jgi:hypothetical protein